eukprot:UN24555
MTLYVGDAITVRKQKSGEKIFRTVIFNKDDIHIQVKPDSEDLKLYPLNNKDFFGSVEKHLKLVEGRTWSTRRRHLNNIRAPPLMPKFTDTGFLTRTLPSEVIKKLRDYWFDNQHRKVPEGFPKDGT